MGAALLEEEQILTANGEDITPEQLLQIPESRGYELIDGKLVERHMGAKATEVIAQTIYLISHHVRLHKLGKVLAPTCGYRCFSWAPQKVRLPDASFIARGRLPEEKAPDGHMSIHPDLAVEVVSPNDLADEIEGRRVDFMRAGTLVFWVIYPASRTVHVFRQGGPATALGENDDLSGEDVLPGFTCKVAALFEGL